MTFPIAAAPRDGSFILAWIEGNQPGSATPFTRELVRWDETAQCWLPEGKQVADIDDRRWQPTHWAHHHPDSVIAPSASDIAAALGEIPAPAAPARSRPLPETLADKLGLGAGARAA